MFTVKKARKLFFIITIVFTTTLIWFVVVGLASNEEAKPSRTSTSTVIIDDHTPTAPGVVLVGFKTADNSIVQLSHDTIFNKTLANIPIKEVEPLFTGSTNIAIAAAPEEEQISSSVYRLRLQPDADVTAVIQALKNDPSVAFAEPDYLAHIIKTPNDPLYSGQWGLPKIQAPAAWDVTTGSTDVVIAVIDSGMDMNHPDLAGQLWTNPGEIAGNGLDDDNNGYVDDVHGWNMVDDNADLSDNTGHGTEVAGIIAAAANNNTGIAGLCWQCRIMVVKVTQSGGVANYSDIAAGIQYAAQKGADVINLSLGAYSDSTTLKSVLANAAETAVIIAGAGNDNSSTPFYPAAYDDYVLAVAGTTSSDTKTGTSNYGVWVDMAAPGEGISTTFDGNTYGTSSGTSLAAPFVAGLAGLLRSYHANWSADMVRAQIIHTTTGIDGLNPGYENQLGSGRLNAQQSLTTAASPMLVYGGHAVDGEEIGRPEPGSTVDVNITLFNDWADAKNVQATLSSPSPYIAIVEGTAVFGDVAAYDKAQSSFRIAVSGAAPYAHDLALTLNVTASGGYATAVPVTITTASGIQTVSGIISTNTTWANNKQYIVTGNILVQAGVTLTIQAGTTIKVGQGNVLRVDGNLVAQGTETNPILFTSNNAQPSPGDWIGIDTGYSGGIANLTHCEISYAEFAISSSLNTAQNNVSRCYIHHNNVGIQTDNDLISNNRITHNSQVGILLHGPSDPATIVNNEIAYNSEKGIYSGSDATIFGNLIHHNGYGFSGNIGIVGGKIISNTILWNDYGIEFSGQLSAPMNHNNLWGNSVYDVKHTNSENVTISQNWWGTTALNLIDQHIYDFQDDFNLGIVSYTPILTAPEPDAPAFLRSLSISPASPIGIEMATFTLTFSRPMDESIDPIVTFGKAAPYATYQVLDQAFWLDEVHWRGTFDVTSLVPRGNYTIRVSNAQGTDGMVIAADTRFVFTVDYAGEITVQTPPEPPTVIAGGVDGNPSSVMAIWTATDPNSPITGYRYAIGSAPSATDIVNWTAVDGTTISRSGLGLIEGQQYWLSVQARNNGGLWSASSYSAFVSGQPYSQLFLPLILKK